MVEGASAAPLQLRCRISLSPERPLHHPSLATLATDGPPPPRCFASQGRTNKERYAACAAAAPLNVNPERPAEIVTVSPSLILPERISSDSGSCTDFWITRLR